MRRPHPLDYASTTAAEASSQTLASHGLVDRERELTRLDSALQAARSGTGVTVLIEGPAGIGKSSLLAVARERAAVAGMTVLQSRGSPLEREYGMGVARQWFDPVLRSHPDRDDLLQGAAHLAESVLIEIPEELATAPAGVLHGLYWLTANLAERAPLLAVVDDAHWADESSLRFLAYLARRVESLPVALVIASRTDEAGSSAESLVELRSDPSTHVAQPQPLPPAAVEEFLRTLDAGPVEEEFARACHEATGGNPFLLGELARSLRDEDVPFTAAGMPQVTEITPPTVAEAIRARLERLGESPRALARATSTLGEEVELDLSADLAEISMAEAAAAAGELAQAGILLDATPLQFRHPLLATAVRAGLSAPERAAAHARAAELLRARGAGPERVALQLMQAPPAGDEEVVADLRAAAERALARGAPSTAAALLRRAVAEPPEASLRAIVLLELANAEYAVGRRREAHAHFDEAHRAAVEPSTRGRAILGLFHAGAGTHEEWRAVSALVERVLPDLAPHDRELGLRLQAIPVLAAAGTPEGQARLVRESRALTGATPGEAIVLGHLALARVGRGATAAEIADIAERAARQADALVEEGASQLVLTGIMLPLRWSDRLDAAQDLLDRAAAIAQRRGSTTDFATVLCERSFVQRRAGRLLEAEADARSAIAAVGDPAVVRRNALTPLIGCMVDQGRVAEAARELAAGHPEEEEVRDAPALTALLLERMRLRAAAGDRPRALADWEEAVRRADRLRGLHPGWTSDVVVAAEIHHALGREAEAQELTAKAIDLASEWGTPGAIGEALHARARLAGGDDAVEMLREAVGHLEQSPARLELARALVTLGASLRRAGHRSESRAPLRQGYELARHAGALALAETARAELRSSGVRLRREALSGVESLTPSERRIADMAAAGASNPEIAQALFLTVKTVEMHLSRAYRKLDINRRTELPGALAGKM